MSYGCGCGYSAITFWMGQQARAYAKGQSWEAIMDELIEVYAGLIAARRRQRVAV